MNRDKDFRGFLLLFHRLSYLCEYKSKEGEGYDKTSFLILGLLAALTFAEPVLACTSAVVSGRLLLTAVRCYGKTVIRTICEIM